MLLRRIHAYKQNDPIYVGYAIFTTALLFIAHYLGRALCMHMKIKITLGHALGLQSGSTCDQTACLNVLFVS